ncbi:putative cytochrome P450 [Annulohypoxylon maeteangense]|uniref:putative cytochrome P450 n=1 Tax=Annulohypoxylon maeteangense TaxID=1927788 RepID=UPI0020080A76|nr:putative cytochrome P450 [Annulohypoxylon maeteangense]KAI0882407.1 putative cytochrome P450 [Annulohypoxylon maeteangense]
MSNVSESLDVGTSNVAKYGILAVTLIVTYQVYQIIYNIYFHPLRNFPGPLSQRASRLPWAIRHAIGSQAFHTQKLHDKYGTVVRVGPDHLSFTDARAWKDIYGHRVGTESNMNEMAKAHTFNKTIRHIPTSIINADREEHSRFRRALSHGFSDSAMRQQEPMISRYVDLLLKRLHEECGDGENKLNIEAWYNWTTFDIVGDLVFGQSFRCLENIHYHPWIEFIFSSVRFGAVIVAMTYIGLGELVQVMVKVSANTIKRVQKYTEDMVRTRLAMEHERDDLFEGLVKRREDWGLSFEKLSSSAFILVLAGSETTATTLSGATFLLLANPEILEKLKREVRSSFKSVDEININSVNKLSYMLAILNEALRLYPPVTSTLVRTVPPGGDQIAGQFVAGGSFVEVQHWAMNHSKENWKDPWTFNPDRFLATPEEAAKAGNKLEALQAFNVGPRNCIGRNLAYAEMRLILARIIYEFDIELSNESQRWIERQKTFALWERIPLYVHLTPVKR